MNTGRQQSSYLFRAAQWIGIMGETVIRQQSIARLTVDDVNEPTTLWEGQTVRRRGDDYIQVKQHESRGSVWAAEHLHDTNEDAQCLKLQITALLSLEWALTEAAGSTDSLMCLQRPRRDKPSTRVERAFHISPTRLLHTITSAKSVGQLLVNLT